MSPRCAFDLLYQNLTTPICELVPGPLRTMVVLAARRIAAELIIQLDEAGELTSPDLATALGLEHDDAVPLGARGVA